MPKNIKQLYGRKFKMAPQGTTPRKPKKYRKGYTASQRWGRKLNLATLDRNHFSPGFKRQFRYKIRNSCNSRNRIFKQRDEVTRSRWSNNR